MVRPVKKLIDSACAMPGMTCGLMRIFICGSVRTSGRFTTCCQKVPPSTALWPARTTPRPRQPSWTSPPPMITGVPARSPHCRAAVSVTAPSGVPVSLTGESRSARSPAISSRAGRQSRLNRSSIPVVPALEGSTASSPESFAASQSLIMVMVAA